MRINDETDKIIVKNLEKENNSFKSPKIEMVINNEIDKNIMKKKNGIKFVDEGKFDFKN
jgi:hypothetical protein